MRITATIPDHGALVMAIMEGFVQAAQLVVRAGVVPPFPTAVPGLKFIKESKGEENWLLPNQVLEAGGGDCEDLSFWEAAGLRETGADPQATVVLVQTGQHDLHAVVLMSDGSYRDPAQMLRAVQSTLSRRKKSPAIGDGTYLHDHRAPRGAPGTPPPQPSLQAAAAPTGNQPAQMAAYEAARLAAALKRGFSDPRVVHERVDGRAFEGTVDDVRAGFGKSSGRQQYDTPEAAAAAGITFVQDDQTGDAYYMRATELDQAAWNQGISPDDLRDQLAYEQQYEQQYGLDGFAGGYPDFSQYGGFPNPYGVDDPFPADPSLFYAQQFGAFAGTGDGGDVVEDLGIDPESVIDVGDDVGVVDG